MYITFENWDELYHILVHVIMNVVISFYPSFKVCDLFFSLS